MMKSSLLLVVVLLSCVPLAAQAGVPGKPPAPAAAELSFLGEAAKKLDGFATYTLRVGYPRRAKEIYREVIAEYDTDDAVARKALGFIRSGSLWAPHPDHVFPDEERPDAAIAKLVTKKWKALCKALGKGHRQLAGELESAGHKARAQYHAGRVLRFLPNDSVAAKARGLKNFQGFVGTPRDIAILERSRMMDRAVAMELKRNYKVERLGADAKNRYLERGGVPYIGVKSENYRVWGNWDAEVLMEAARNAERSLAFCRVAYQGFDGYPAKAGMIHDLAFFMKKDDWATVVRANSNLYSKSTLAFIIEHTAATQMGGGKTGLKVAGVEEKAIVNDLAVRWPAQMYSTFHTDALVEGIGHAVVGRFFGRNLVFTVGRKKKKQAGTVVGKPKQEKLILPDLSSWEEAAVESAWQRDSTPVAKLPLISSATFPDDGRIKSWSFCDYMMRRSLSELRALDRTKGAKTEPEVAEKFRKSTGGDVFELEESWRKFWIDDTPLLRAIKNKMTPLEAVSKAAPEWLEQFNRVRHYYLTGINSRYTTEQTSVGWSSAYSADCKMHAQYLKSNRGERGPAKEHTQKVELKLGTNKGRAFARTALVSTKGKDAKKVIEQWMAWPGYRDAILNFNLDTVGLFVDGQLMVMDVTRGQVRKTESTIAWYPNQNCRNLGQNGDRSIGHEVAVKDLGPDVEALLAKRGKKGVKIIGYPLSIHFYGGVPKASTLKCWVKRGKEDVKGILHFASDGKSRRTAAAGLVVFYPLKPLKRGSEYEIEWSWGTKSQRFKFMTN